MKKLKQLTDVARRAGYLDIEEERDIRLKSLLPLGDLLYENIRKVWQPTEKSLNIYNTIDNNTETTLRQLDPKLYYDSQQFKSIFCLAKNCFKKISPIAVSDTLKTQEEPNEDSSSSENVSIVTNSNLFLLCSYFVTEAQSKEFFFKIQRQRKIWWMKFSSNPGRFMFYNPKKLVINNRQIEQVSIVAKYAFGNIHLEDIQLIPLKILPKSTQSLYFLKDGRDKNFLPSVVRTSMSLEVATVQTTLDAIDSSDSNTICLHRTIAPYQCAIFNYSQDGTIASDLEDLSKYVAAILRNAQISVRPHNCSVSSLKTLQTECRLMDEIGIPYGIIIEENALKTGLMKLRSRDTTLSETIHITDLPKYLIEIVTLKY